MRALQVVAGWVMTWGRVTIGATMLLMALLMLAAWLDPQREARRRRAAGDVHAAKIRAEAVRAAVPIPVAPDGVTEITFKSLEFVPLADPKVAGTGMVAFAPLAPPRIAKLDAQRVRITGYMLPTRNEGGGGREFLILANHSKCCFGREPRFCDYILGRFEGDAIPPVLDTPVNFEGTLHVRDRHVDGYWSALYSLDCTKITR